jgi:transcriptional regulator of met regulon
MAKCNESFPQKMESSRTPMLGIPGRHFAGSKFPSDGAKTVDKMLEDLENSGMVVNVKKSQLVPTQQVDHLGFTVDFHRVTLQVPQENLKAIRKELGKLVTHKEMSCRKMAAILGATMSFLMTMPFLRAFTDQLVQFVNQQETLGWDYKVPIPAQLRQQVREMHFLLEEWKGRKFQ